MPINKEKKKQIAAIVERPLAAAIEYLAASEERGAAFRLNRLIEADVKAHFHLLPKEMQDELRDKL